MCFGGIFCLFCGGKEKFLRLKDEYNLYSLPLCVHVVVYFLVCDGQHHNEYPQEDHADHELVEYPHGHHGRVDGVCPGPPDEDTAGHVVSGDPGEAKCEDAGDPEM